MKLILNIFKVMVSFIDDACILMGLTLIIEATFMLSYVAGMYILGIILLFLGTVMAKKTKKK
ncbi:MAG TPA: hypothetical protein VIM42_04295 [Clostridium sp.]